MFIFGYSLYFVVFLVSPVDSRVQDSRYHHTTVLTGQGNHGSLYIAGYTIVPGVTASFERPSRGSDDGKISWRIGASVHRRGSEV